MNDFIDIRPRAYAHSLEDRPETEWESLEIHLQRVARLAGDFAEAFDAGEWGRLAGLWHDLGKFRPEFQARLRGSRESVEHAGLGAALAYSKSRDRGLPLAFAIAGHHSGLADLTTAAASEGGPRPLRERLASNQQVLATTRQHLPDRLTAPDLPPLPGDFDLTRPQGVRSLELWTRFLFSSLVDADFRDDAFRRPRPLGSRALEAGHPVADRAHSRPARDQVHRLSPQ